MKIVIANHIDPQIRLRADLRAWTQRAFWFAEPSDMLILPCVPDLRFLSYATGLTGVDPASLRIHVTSPGGFGPGLMDPAALCDPNLLDAVRVDLGEVSEVFALWPSASVARFADALGLTDRLPGAAFLAQGGGELVNNKAEFRALAAAAGVPIAPGAVCHAPDEAAAVMRRLLAEHEAVLVKQAHNGAGVGNEIVSATIASTGHVGARHRHQLAPGPDGVAAYWEQRWGWASAGGRFPVIVEACLPDGVTVYSEHHATDYGTRPTQTGLLAYEDGKLTWQTIPVPDLNSAVSSRLLDGGGRLAEAYRAIGYRGPLSADAVATPDGQVCFTEVNAQVSGSLHLYDVLAAQVVRTSEDPRRWIAETHVPAHWAVAGFDEFTTALTELDCGFDPATRVGVIVSMPILAAEDGRAQFLFTIAYDTPSRRDDIYRQLDAHFTRTLTEAHAAGR